MIKENRLTNMKSKDKCIWKIYLVYFLSSVTGFNRKITVCFNIYHVIIS